MPDGCKLNGTLIVGIVLSLFSAVAFSFSNIFVKKGTVRENFLASIFVTMLASETIVVAISAVSGELFQIMDLTPFAIFIYGLTGFLGFTVGRTLNYSSISNLGPSLTSTVISGRIIFALLLSIFILSDNVTPLDILGDIVVTVGIIIVTLDKRSTGKFPTIYLIILIVAAAAIGAGDVLIRVGDNLSSLPIDGTFVAYAIGILSYIPIQGRQIFRKVGSLPRINVRFLLMAGTASGFAQVFRFTGLTYAPVFIAVPLMSLTPIITVYFSSVSLGDENIKAKFVAGVLITIIGIFILNALPSMGF